MSNNKSYNNLFKNDNIGKPDLAHFLCTRYNGIDLIILFNYILTYNIILKVYKIL